MVDVNPEAKNQIEDIREHIEVLRQGFSVLAEKYSKVDFFVAHITAELSLTVEGESSDMRVSDMFAVPVEIKDLEQAEAAAMTEAKRRWPEAEGYYEHHVLTAACTLRLPDLAVAFNLMLQTLEAVPASMEAFLDSA